SGSEVDITAGYVIDATELGDLLPLTGTEYVTGTESKGETGELHAPDQADVKDVQAFTTCFAIDYSPGEDFVQKSANYALWPSCVPPIQPVWCGRLLHCHDSNPRTLQPKRWCFDPRPGVSVEESLNWWGCRRIIDRSIFRPGFYHSDIGLVNWPQNDYMLG